MQDLYVTLGFFAELPQNSFVTSASSRRGLIQFSLTDFLPKAWMHGNRTLEISDLRIETSCRGPAFFHFQPVRNFGMYSPVSARLQAIPWTMKHVKSLELTRNRSPTTEIWSMRKNCAASSTRRHIAMSTPTVTASCKLLVAIAKENKPNIYPGCLISLQMSLMRQGRLASMLKIFSAP